MGACILELRYQATLSGPGTSTPQLTRVRATYSGDNPTTECDHTYDSLGRMLTLTPYSGGGAGPPTSQSGERSV